MFEEEKAKNPTNYVNYKAPSPGPGSYAAEDSSVFKKTTDFQKPNQTAFLSSEPKKIDEVDKVQIPTIENPGPGTYKHAL